MRPGAAGEAEAVQNICEHIGDVWGAALASLLRGWSLVRSGEGEREGEAELVHAAETFHDLGSGVLETWSRALLAVALAQQGDKTAKAVALRAESSSNSTVVEGPKAFIYLALAIVDDSHAGQFVQLAKACVMQTGLDPRILEIGLSAIGSEPTHTISIRCFGEFRFLIDGRPLAMSSMKPRTRALLRRLCADAGAAIHREVLEEALWPDAEAGAAARTLQVAISSLRKALEPGISRGASSLLVREGDSYRLVLPPDADVDVRDFDQTLERSRRARQAGDSELALEAFRQAAAFAANELFPEDGSAEWVIVRRGRARAGVVDAARPLAKLLLARSQHQAAAEVCASALTADRYADELWRLLIEAREKGGDEAGSRRAHTEYRRLVSDLDLSPSRP
jgi:DNA-binding SARP family transcriptional activator